MAGPGGDRSDRVAQPIHHPGWMPTSASFAPNFGARTAPQRESRVPLSVRDQKTPAKIVTGNFEQSGNHLRDRRSDRFSVADSNGEGPESLAEEYRDDDSDGGL